MRKRIESIKLQETQQRNVNQINDTLQEETTTITLERLERLSVQVQNKHDLTKYLYWPDSTKGILNIPVDLIKENKNILCDNCSKT